MFFRPHIAIAAVLLGCVLFVFVSPAINLPYTTLQGSRQGAARLLILVALFAWASTLTAGMHMFRAWLRYLVPILFSDSVIDITCIRRC